MAEYPTHLIVRRRLRDGRTVTIRPIRADDAPLEREFVQRLSGETRYLRFQKWVQSPSDRLIHFLTEVDYDRHLALVCAFEGEGGEEVVGEARYVADTGGESCELGIVIADAWQKSGIAGLLMNALLEAARARGLKSMEGVVFSTNRDMLRFVRALGFEAKPVPGDRTMVRIEKAL
jgi:acetyltransferase